MSYGARPLVAVLFLAWSLSAQAEGPAGQPLPRADGHDDPLPGGAVARLGSTRWRLRAGPTGMVVSPDGNVLAVRTDDLTVEVLDAWTGRRRLTLGMPRHASGPPESAAMAFSRDGKRFAASLTLGKRRNALISLRAGPGMREERCLAYRKPDAEQPRLPAEAERAPNRRGFTEEYVSALALTPDGKVLAAAIRFSFRYQWWEGGQEPKVFEKEENTIRLWEAGSGKRLGELSGHRKEIKGLLFAADGTTLISVDAEGSICFHDPTTGREKRARVNVGRPLFCVASSADGKLLAAGTRGLVLVCEMATGNLRQRLATPVPGVRSVAFSPDGKLLAGGGGRVLRLWRTATGKILGDLSPVDHLVSAVAFSGDSSRLFSGHQGEQVVRCWDVATLRPTVPLDGHAAPVSALAFTPDGKHIVSATLEPVFRSWDARSGKPWAGRTEDRQRLASYGLASAAGAWLCHCENGRDLRPGFFPAPRLYLPEQKPGSVAFACSADGKRVLAFETRPGRKPALVVRSRPDGKILREFVWKEGKQVLASLSPDGRTVAAAGGDVVCFLDVASGKEQRYTYPPRGEAFHPIFVKFAADGARIVVVGEPATLRVVAVGDGRLLAEIQETFWDFIGGLADVALSPDGRTLAVGKYLGSLMVREVATGQLIRHHRGDGLLFSPDNRHVAILDRDALRIHDLFSGALLWQYREMNDLTGDIAFSPDGRLLAAACRDTTVLVWDLDLVRKRQKPQPLDDQDLERLWKDLQERASGGPDIEVWQKQPGSRWPDLARGRSATAYEAMGQLRARPEGVVRFLQKRLLVPPADGARLRRSIADLDSDRFATRETASRALAKLGRAAGPALRTALRGKPSLEVRLRIERLFRTIQREEDRLSPAYIRAIQVLEGIRTKDARQLLKALAEGSGGPHAAREACAALQRLQVKSRVEQ